MFEVMINLQSLIIGMFAGTALSSAIWFAMMYGERFTDGFGEGFHEGAEYERNRNKKEMGDDGRQVNEQKET